LNPEEQNLLDEFIQAQNDASKDTGA